MGETPEVGVMVDQASFALAPADAVDGERLLATMLELIAIDSPTGHEETIGKELERRLTGLGCTVQRDEHGNLIARLPGTRPGADTVLLSFHMDTAGTDVGIKPVIRDGVVYSEGDTILGADDKSGLAGLLELLILLGERPDWKHPPLEIVISVGEESGLLGSRALDASQLTAAYGFVFDTGDPIGSITYNAPSTTYMAVTMKGRRAHAGVEPEKGISAIQAAADAITTMRLGRIDEETVANIGTIHGGQARNIVPDVVDMDAMVRSRSNDKLDAQVATMETELRAAADRWGATVEIVRDDVYRAYLIDFDARPYREAARAAEALGIKPRARQSGGGTDGNVYNAAGTPCVALSTGMADEHGPNEHIAIEDLVNGCRHLVQIVTQEPATEGAVS
jgi:tripeptide aminopeptidase